MPTNNSINLSASGYSVYDGAGTFSGRTFQAGTGVTIANASGTAGNTTISAIGGGLTWTDVTGTTQTMAVNSGYTSNDGASLVTFTLPTTAAYGSLFAVVGKASGLWTLNYGTGQIIHFGAVNTTITTGSLSSTKQYDSVYLLCTIANTDFTVVQSFGNITYV